MRLFALLVVTGLCLLQPQRVLANRLQVAPTLVEIGNKRAAEALWITNTGTAPITAQIRIFGWHQDDAGEHLTPTSEVVVSPAQATLAPGDRQMIRILRRGAAPATERAFRILVDELGRKTQPAASTAGLQIRLRYSIPVFVAAAPSGANGEPRLTATLSVGSDPAPDHQMLIENAGFGRAQLAEAVLLTPDGHQIVLSRGLLGYVLAQRAMRWPVSWNPSIPLPDVLELRARINGEPKFRQLGVRVVRR